MGNGNSNETREEYSHLNSRDSAETEEDVKSALRAAAVEERANKKRAEVRSVKDVKKSRNFDILFDKGPKPPELTPHSKLPEGSKPIKLKLNTTEKKVKHTRKWGETAQEASLRNQRADLAIKSGNRKKVKDVGKAKRDKNLELLLRDEKDQSLYSSLMKASAESKRSPKKRSKSPNIELREEDRDVYMLIKNSLIFIKENPPKQILSSAKLVRGIYRNILKHPNEEKYRKLRLSNEKIHALLVETDGVLAHMLSFGWDVQTMPCGDNEELSEEHLYYSPESPLRNLEIAIYVVNEELS